VVGIVEVSPESTLGLLRGLRTEAHPWRKVVSRGIVGREEIVGKRVAVETSGGLVTAGSRRSVDLADSEMDRSGAVAEGIGDLVPLLLIQANTFRR
jgi:hypothetical protein